ncbi:MAG: hypothetical protein Q9212_002487 [Teloschistes hypoglaucus]
MSSTAKTLTPGLAAFLASIKDRPRRQIRNSQPCALATAHILRQVVGAFRVGEVGTLVEKIQQTGDKLVAAQPKELAVDNVVRRVLRVVRDEEDEDRHGQLSAFDDARSKSPGNRVLPLPPSPSLAGTSPPRGNTNEQPSVSASHASSGGAAAVNLHSLFGLLSQPSSKGPSPWDTPNHHSPRLAPSISDGGRDLKAEVMEGIEEIIDELNQVDDQIAGYALDHIHSNEVVLIQSPSATLRKFLLRAAAKRKFTVVCAHNSSRDPWNIHTAATHIPINHNGEGTVDIMQRSLIAAGITVVTVPHSAVYALMSRVSKVYLDSHIVLADGAFVAAAGARVIAKAANVHRTPVIVLSGVYKLSPIHTSNPNWLIEYGVPHEVFSFDQSNAMGEIDTVNPLQDYIPAEAVDLYITNLGGHSPSYMYRVVGDHYRLEDVHITDLAA